MIASSESINDLITALALAQAQFPPIPKSKTGKVKGESKGTGKAYEFEYQYADISDVLVAVRPILSQNGLAILQLTEVDEANVMFVRTRLAHKSGQWIESSYPVCSINADHQKMGGALTYARRYSLTSLIGVAAEDDLDGQGGSAGSVDTHPRQTRNAGPSEFDRAQYVIRNAPSKVDLKAVWDAVDWDSLSAEQTTSITADKDARLSELNKPKVAVQPNFDAFPGDLPSETVAAVKNGNTP